jgi:2-keto-4-pentenoate hydratase
MAHERMNLDPLIGAGLRQQLQQRSATLEAGAEHIGWKVGASIAEIDALSAGTPVIGYLTTATLVSDGGVYHATGAVELYAETELVFSVDGFRLGLELVDTARPPGGPVAVIANNVFHRAVVLGRRRARTPGAEARLWVDGNLRAAERVRTNIDATRRHVAALLEALEQRLDDEDELLAGSLTRVRVVPGQQVAAEIDGLGRVSVTIAR